MTRSGLDIRLLGPVWLTVDGHPVPVGGRKPQALLAILTINRRRSLSARLLIDAVWDEKPPRHAMDGLYNYVAGLRRELRTAGVDDGAILRMGGPGCYQLDIADTDCDLGRFELARSAGLAATGHGDHALAAEHFATALGQFGDEPVAGLRGVGFADRFATDLGERRLAVVAARADAEIACGRAGSVIAELSAATEAHPLREDLWQRLIRALYAAGRGAEALDAYHRVRETLAEELGLDPDPETDRVRDAILRQRPLPPPGPAPARTATAAPGTSPAATLRWDDGRVTPIPARGLRIGRGGDNDLILDDPRVSRSHAHLVVRAAGVVVHDLGSVNGVYVNGAQILGFAQLTDGDTLGIGATTLCFERRPPGQYSAW